MVITPRVRKNCREGKITKVTRKTATLRNLDKFFTNLVKVIFYGVYARSGGCGIGEEDFGRTIEITTSQDL
jgi:hypothetical protein